MNIDIITSRQEKSEIIFEGTLKPSSIIEPEKQYFAIVDSSVEWFYETHFSKLSNVQHWKFKNPSEQNKSWATVSSILNLLFNANADRSAVLLAIGGGVTLDVVGYAASIYKRGIPWIGIPSTLLAQVDASVGGKTAINHKAGKNALGTFHPPQKVFITPIVADTWTEELRLEGLAEIYKIFKLFDHKSLKELLAHHNVDRLTHRSIELKANVVRVDPWENNLRAALNYGHTFGHALEYVKKMRHGIAVALGIRCANAVAEHIGIMTSDKRIEADEELDKLGFQRPRSMPPFSSLKPFLLQDKKNIRGDVMMCLPNGKSEWPIEPSDPRKKVSWAELENSYNSILVK
jgi:3-dehydroquinate synthase